MRDAKMPVSSAKAAHSFYSALHAFEAGLTRNSISHKLRSGECVAFDNRRILHGRQGYTLKEGGKRRLIGSYLDWDEVLSKKRYLMGVHEAHQN